MELPCRHCTDTAEDQKEVLKPLSAFTTATKVSEIWKDTLSKGQDLCCLKCQHLLGTNMLLDVIPCDGCGCIKTRGEFGSKMQELWKLRSTDVIMCIKCDTRGQKGRPAREVDAEFLFCNGTCQKKVLVTHFVESMVADWTSKKMLLLAKCARCVVKDIAGKLHHILVDTNIIGVSIFSVVAHSCALLVLVCTGIWGRREGSLRTRNQTLYTKIWCESPGERLLTWDRSISIRVVAATS